MRLYKTAGCTGTPRRPRARPPSSPRPGITVSVADNTTTAFRARAMDAAGNLSPCSGAVHLRRGLDAVATGPLRTRSRRARPDVVRVRAAGAIGVRDRAGAASATGCGDRLAIARRCLPCRCSPRPRPRRPDRSSSASSRAATLDRPGHPGDGRRPGPDGPLPAQLGMGAADPGLLRLGRDGPVHRPPCLARNPGGPVRVGEPGLGGAARPRTPPLDRPADRAGVAELPQGGWWRATGRAAATGPTATASSSDRAPRRCRSSPGRSGTSPI